MADSARIKVEVDGRELSLSNLHKVLYPEDGFTKGEVIDYYRQVAPALLPAIADRAATRKRYPDGVDASSFFEKNAPSHTPGWIRTVTLPSPGSSRDREEVTYVVVDDLPTLVWCANLAVLELHVPQWTVGPRGGVRAPDLLVLDLDPGPGTDVVQCCEVGVWLREALEDDGLSPVAKTSGSKGMQLYVPLNTPHTHEHCAEFAHAVAQVLEKHHGQRVTSVMKKAARPGKVFIDWSQNSRHKTTVAVYSLRARPHPTVSTPVTWDEVASCWESKDATTLRFEAGAVLDRVDKLGDLFKPAIEFEQTLPQIG